MTDERVSRGKSAAVFTATRKKKTGARVQIAVTGSRGKSSVVRLLHAALTACSLKTYARVTGVIPRTLTPDGERPILRFAPPSVDEMKWWLRTIPSDAQAVVMENSAVVPHLQGVCPVCLHPQVTVLTNVRPDHEAYWGPSENDVLRALSEALPVGGAVVLPRFLAVWAPMRHLSAERRLALFPSEKVPGFPTHLAENMGLALEVCRFFHLDEDLCLSAMDKMEPDLADFTVLAAGDFRLAFAFSANDVQTTEELFLSTSWSREETGVLFNHRSDRVDRFRTFESWMKDNNWREVVVIGDRPPSGSGWCEYRACAATKDLLNRLGGGDWIGCGNSVYGLPLAFKLECEERGNHS